MCKVYRVVDRKNKNQEYAVRVMKIHEESAMNKIKIEIALMKMLEHKNVVKYVNTYVYMNCLFMIIEFMNGGALTDIIYQNLK